MMEDQSVFEFGDDWEIYDLNIEEPEEHLVRVSSRIARAIVQFCQEHKEFHADELRAAVTQATGSTAPGSADRILRDLRKRGIVDYVVVSRRKSLYRVISLRSGDDGKANSA